ncbi:MAG: hypothetical protein A3F69_04990, partial [Acidobacteria bacterium RIFCSPLOWO2_12_FULL_66_10]
TIHSWLRWAALALGAGAIVRAYLRRHDADERSPKSRWDTFFMLALDLQVFFGLVLYFGFSPFTREAMNDLAAAVRNPLLRFWAIEHIGAMFGAAIAVRIGRVLAMNAPTPMARQRQRLIWFGIAELIMIAGTPWPGPFGGRPLFRL